MLFLCKRTSIPDWASVMFETVVKLLDGLTSRFPHVDFYWVSAVSHLWPKVDEIDLLKL
jgi:hypothetical protein